MHIFSSFEQEVAGGTGKGEGAGTNQAAVSGAQQAEEASGAAQ